MKIAVCVHLYHLDMWDEIENYLKNLKHQYVLYVNFTYETDGKLVTDFNWREYVNLYPDLIKAGKNNHDRAYKHFIKYGISEKRLYKNAQIQTRNKILNFKNDSIILMSPNIGVDIGAFLNTYKHVDSDVDLILKIHTKKGLGGIKNPSLVSKRFGHNEAIKIGDKWFNQLMVGVLNTEDQVSRIIEEFKKNDKCGMVGFMGHENFSHNLNEMIKLFPILKIPKHIENTKFVGGTIFWVRNDILKKYLNNETIDSLLVNLPHGYVHEPSPNHAMERIFGSMVYNENKELLIIN